MRTYKIELRLIAIDSNPVASDQQTLNDLAVVETVDLLAAEQVFLECQRVIKKEVV